MQPVLPLRVGTGEADTDEHDEARVLPLPEWKPLMPSRDFARLTTVLEARCTGVAAYFDGRDRETA